MTAKEQRELALSYLGKLLDRRGIFPQRRAGLTAKSMLFILKGRQRELQHEASHPPSPMPAGVWKRLQASGRFSAVKLKAMKGAVGQKRLQRQQEIQQEISTLKLARTVLIPKAPRPTVSRSRVAKSRRRPARR